jgi:trans-2,3-dihydro-3-hydroxyanthranilate isomerase
MTSHRFVTVDVFTDARFGGNPLAVFPDARGLTGEQMQALATEFNLSETTFVLPPADPANTARVRIFNPTAEMPFAGHPMVGTGYVLAQERGGEDLRFEVPAGLVQVRVERGGSGEIAGATIEAPRPLSLGETLPADVIAACVGISPHEVLTARHEPVLASMGNPFVIAEVAGEALTRALPHVDRFRQAEGERDWLKGRLSLHLYARDGGRVRARMFAPLSGVFEDPATGSANTPLAGLLLSLGQEEQATYEVVQGVEMGRPSLLRLAAWRGADGIRASVGGGCVPVLQGEALA